MTPTPPKLSELSAEQRRILVAEACGWTNINSLSGNMRDQGPDDFGDGYWNELPDYDHDLNDAFALCLHLERKFYGWTLGRDYNRNFYCAFKKHPADAIIGREDSLPKAIASAFLLTKNLATL